MCKRRFIAPTENAPHLTFITALYPALYKTPGLLVYLLSLSRSLSFLLSFKGPLKRMQSDQVRVSLRIRQLVGYYPSL